jgi:hypothetical protein
MLLRKAMGMPLCKCERPLCAARVPRIGVIHTLIPYRPLEPFILSSRVGRGARRCFGCAGYTTGFNNMVGVPRPLSRPLSLSLALSPSLSPSLPLSLSPSLSPSLPLSVPPSA